MIKIGQEQETSGAYMTNPIIIEDVFLHDDFEKIEKMLQGLQHIEGVKAHDHEGYRSGKSVVVPYNDENAWFFGWMYEVVNDINQKYYGFDPIDWHENMVYHVYDEGQGCGLHMDLDGLWEFGNRKLTVVISLSSSEEYRGGDFDIYTNWDFYRVGRGKGTIAIFPSYLAYSIGKLESGQRRDLCFWIGGRSFS